MELPALDPAVREFYAGRPIPRGIRNNNPGNIRLGSKWKGLCLDQTDPSFCQFVDYQHGLRAMVVLLVNYVKRDHVTTVAEAIHRWAPPEENNTAAYLEDVCLHTSLSSTSLLSTFDVVTLAELVEAICGHECGRPLPYPAGAYYNAAVSAVRGDA